ncbi:MAG TPA: biotin/lipoyl-binding protein, partial [Ramlibacter sp.]|nr:biotin/lipoyl-binding protein [Ramlibacter sp.]
MTPARSHRFIWVLAALVAVGVAAALAVWLARRPAESAAVQMQLRPLVRTLQFSARVSSLSRVDVGPTVTGRVERVLVDAGARVVAGQPLVLLEQDELRAALQQALATEQQAVARLAGLRGPGRLGAGAGVAQADATLRNARAELARVEQLVAQGFLSASRLDDARRVVDVAAAQQTAARAQ